MRASYTGLFLLSLPVASYVSHHYPLCHSLFLFLFYKLISLILTNSLLPFSSPFPPFPLPSFSFDLFSSPPLFVLLKMRESVLMLASFEKTTDHLFDAAVHSRWAIHMCVCVCVCVFMYVYIYMCMYVCVYICVCVCIGVCLCMYIYVCVYVCIGVYVCMYIYMRVCVWFN